MLIANRGDGRGGKTISIKLLARAIMIKTKSRRMQIEVISSASAKALLNPSLIEAIWLTKKKRNFDTESSF